MRIAFIAAGCFLTVQAVAEAPAAEPAPSPENKVQLTDLPRRARADIVYAARRMLQFDKDGDKKLTQDELPSRMEGLVAKGDSNGDGCLDEDELTVMSFHQWQKRNAKVEAEEKAAAGKSGGEEH